MNKTEKMVLDYIRKIKSEIEASNMPLDNQYICISNMQKILDILNINN